VQKGRQKKHLTRITARWSCGRFGCTRAKTKNKRQIEGRTGNVHIRIAYCIDAQIDIVDLESVFSARSSAHANAPHQCYMNVYVRVCNYMRATLTQFLV